MAIYNEHERSPESRRLPDDLDRTARGSSSFGYGLLGILALALFAWLFFGGSMRTVFNAPSKNVPSTTAPVNPTTPATIPERQTTTP